MKAWLEERKREKVVRDLILRLRDPDESEWRRAEDELLKSGPESFAILIQMLERRVRNRRRLPWIILAHLLGYPIVMATMFAIVFPNSTGWIGGTVGGLSVGIWNLVNQYKNERNNAARVLARLSDKRVISPLAEALDQVSLDGRFLVASALSRLLPQLSENDVYLLSPAAKAGLNRALFAHEWMPVGAILRSIEVIGDSTFIPNVQRLAGGAGPAASDQGLRQLAAHCLPVLEERSRNEVQKAILLRAAQADDQPDHTFLRAAGPASPTSDEQLLRATNAQETA